MPLTPGYRLGPYEIVSLLGQGGMGEVYLAHDPRLGRHVAIKILPAAFSTDPDRLWRFEREARVVASLNHPHICTVHDIGEHEGHRYLVMERLEGEPLNARLESGPLSTPLLLDLAVQIADALDAAHKASVIHRDLKPANIFVTRRGEAKLLDFGLAKVADRTGPAVSGATMASDPDASPTMLSPQGATIVGTLLGTAAYMSPEQARDEPVDARTDLFSLGAVLYEMATGKPAFSGKTMATLFDQILNKEPPPIASLNPQAPGELSPIIGKALEKDRELRYGTAADIGVDLKRLRRDLIPRRASDSAADAMASTQSPALGIPSANSASPIVTPPSPMPGMMPMGKKAAARSMIVAAVLLTAFVLGGGFFVWRSRSPRTEPASEGVSFASLQVTQLTSTGNAFRPVVSPDGKYVVYLQGDSDGASLWLRQVAATSSIEVVGADGLLSPVAATIGPDNAFVDFLRRDGGLWRVPFLGGTPKPVVERANTPVGWSPDGQRMTFVRPSVSGRGQDLVTTNRDGGDERAIASGLVFATGMPGGTLYAPAWSPDGRRVAMFQRLSEDVRDIGIRVFEIANGASQVVNTRGDVPLGLAWFDNATLLIAQALETGTPSQLWRVAFPGSERTRLSNDTNRYSELSLSADGNTLVTARPDTRVELWVGDAKGAGREVVRAAPFLSAAFQYAMVDWDEERLLFTHTLNGRYEIFRTDLEGAHPEPIVAAREFSVAADGTIVFRAVAEGDGLWKVDRTGQRRVELAKGSVSYPFVSRDGQHVVFSSRMTGEQTLWHVSTMGGEPERIMPTPLGIEFFSDISPDGRSIIVGLEGKWTLCDLPGCTDRRPIAAIQGGRVRWMPDGRGYTWVDNALTNNLWLQPLDGSTPHRLTQFDDRKAIGRYAWSRDGKRLAISRAAQASDIVLFRGLKGKP
jgi:serine/threonine protein kinase/Tol biopolymer transport system component